MPNVNSDTSDTPDITKTLEASDEAFGPGNITVITGCAGTGKTTVALNFAQEPGTVFLAGDEDEVVLRQKAARLGLDVSNTTFIDNTSNNKSEVLILNAKRVVVEDFSRLVGPASLWSRKFMDLAVRRNAHILVTVHTRRPASEVTNLADAVKREIPMALSYSATNVIHLDSPFDTRPTGVLVKTRTLLSHQVPDELFGVKLRTEF